MVASLYALKQRGMLANGGMESLLGESRIDTLCAHSNQGKEGRAIVMGLRPCSCQQYTLTENFIYALNLSFLSSGLHFYFFFLNLESLMFNIFTE